ncbi:MAG: GDSL-type esterase/lipase family protein [Aureispira sp.]
MRRTLLLYLLLHWSHFALGQLPTINACGQDHPIHVVIIGSSTAAGTGPSTSDSTWVNRYRAYLQSINSQSQVTNLARGGTTTYHIMPSWFTAPIGRPTTDTNRNVTRALALQPDAIIINMPSNDVASNITLQEQLNNYSVMVATADSSSIPVWVCSTQPRNFGTAAQRGLQVAARDSIFTEYGVQSIDFWTGLATSTHFIEPIYDSGDGVHLNDAAHGILFSRVANKALPNLLADTALSEDFVALTLSNLPYNWCGDTVTTLQVVVGNLGTPSVLSSFLELSILDEITTTITTQSQVIPSMPTCGLDTLTFALNTSTGVQYALEAYVLGSPVPNAGDTSNSLSIQTIGRPALQIQAAFQCTGDSNQIITQGASPTDQVYWYHQMSALSSIYTGNNLPVPPLGNDQIFYAQIARGPFHFFESLSTGASTNTNWNGVAFDIVATDSLTIDSLTTKLADVGLQTVNVYYRRGSHIGFLNSPTDWLLWDSIEVQVPTAGEFYILNVDPLSIPAGDTLGVYLHLQSPSARLSYSNNGQTISHSDAHLEVIGGSGVGHTFGTLYTPRNWAGTVHYHYGSNPDGSCQSSRLPALVEVHTAVDLGPDTTLTNGQSILLAPSGNYTSYQWSDGSSAPSILVDSSWGTMGQALIYVTVTDNNGCSSIDSLQITFSNFTGMFQPSVSSIQLHPNPSTGRLLLTQEQAFEAPIQLVNAQGIVVWKGTQDAQQVLTLEHLPKGIYWLIYHNQQQRCSIGVVLY